MPLSQSDLQTLIAKLPPLHFDGDKDLVWPREPLPLRYFAAYQLPTGDESIGQGFGVVEAAGYRIATQYWLPQEARGTLVIMHGYYDHVGIFHKAIRFALSEGYAVLAFDLPGHGLSSGEQAAIDSFDTYGDVLHELLLQARSLLPQPFHALGQSTGGAVILNYLWRFGDQLQAQPLDKVALFAPLILPRGWRAGRFLFYLLRPFIQRFPRGGASSSHDSDFNRFIETGDPLQSKHLSLKWVSAMAAWHDFVLAAQPLQKTLLVVQGTGDRTVDWRYNLKVMAEKLPQARVELIADAGHQLVNETPEYLQPLLNIAHNFLRGD